MKTTIKYIAPWLAAAAIGGAIGLAPTAAANPAPSPAPSPTPFESGTNPVVSGNVGADPFTPYLGAPLLYQWAMHR